MHRESTTSIPVLPYLVAPHNVFYLVMGHIIVMGHFQFTLSQVQKYQYLNEYYINHVKTLSIDR